MLDSQGLFGRSSTLRSGRSKSTAIPQSKTQTIGADPSLTDVYVYVYDPARAVQSEWSCGDHVMAKKEELLEQAVIEKVNIAL